ncbi:RibD family protein [Hansschlegelia plantiphila]|uniref:Riboflavin deaminase n=1 Tax=Hansschlegelia plantiphila TaxID=374655 RepID=A0A9W6J1J6_9HYPH|nr:RibD family protein [Hansschlegelia plantiphila]GLK69120.1 riboflavin deaminase [Hansschlegelia plantiphila]
MKPQIICLMLSSIDGRLGSGRSGEGAAAEIKARGAAFEAAHDELAGDGWIIGRVTGAEMSKAKPHPPATFDTPLPPHNFAKRDADGYAVIVDPAGKLHFDKADIGGEHVVVLLASGVSDSHLAELAADGVSYVVSNGPEIDLGAALEVLAEELGVRKLLLEGGGGVNGAFLKAGLVDEVVVLIWPSINGITGERAIFEAGEDGLANRLELILASCEAKGGVVRLRYAVKTRER